MSIRSLLQCGFVSILLFLSWGSVLASHPDPCNTICHDVETQSQTTTTANIVLGTYDITVHVKEAISGSTNASALTASIPSEKIYILIGTKKYYCDSNLSSGTCTIRSVPAGYNDHYSLRIENWLNIQRYDNVPFTNSNLHFDTDVNARSINAVLFLVNSCLNQAPPPRCNGAYLQVAAECSTPSTNDPNGFWKYSSPGIDCAQTKVRVCDGVTVVPGVCNFDAQNNEAVCTEDNCVSNICSFSSLLNPDHPHGYFKTGDIITLVGSKFGNVGGEVRIGNTKIYIDASDSRSNFFWTDGSIRFVLPSEAQMGIIGVRPNGYGYKKGLDTNGVVVNLHDENDFLIPLYCYGGIIKIVSYEDLQIEGSLDQIPVSVSGQ